MAKISNKQWSEQEDDKLRSMAARGVSLMRATAAMRRSTAAVKRRAQELGLTFRTPTQERDRLRAAMSA